MSTSSCWSRFAALAAVALLGCSNAGEDFGFTPSGSGTVLGFVYLDRDGSLDISQSDTVFAGVRVGLVSGASDTVFSALVDATGNVRFTGVPFGDYQFVVDTNTVGDSLQVQAIDLAAVHLRANAGSQTIISRLGYPFSTTAAVRGLPVGSRVFVKGVALSSIGIFGDTTSYLTDNNAPIRLTDATNGGPVSAAGDSVRVLGTVAIRSGQAVLDTAIVFVFRFGPPPVPVQLSTLLAGTAAGGTQDAGLVNLTNAIITATAAVGPDFHVTVDDGSGPLVIELDGDLVFSLAQFQINKTVNGQGVLVPGGNGAWLFKPRQPSDVTVN